jgi:hypothetical protein
MLLACGSMVLDVLSVFRFCAHRAQKRNTKMKLTCRCEWSHLGHRVSSGILAVLLFRSQSEKEAQ